MSEQQAMMLAAKQTGSPGMQGMGQGPYAGVFPQGPQNPQTLFQPQSGIGNVLQNEKFMQGIGGMGQMFMNQAQRPMGGVLQQPPQMPIQQAMGQIAPPMPTTSKPQTTRSRIY